MEGKEIVSAGKKGRKTSAALGQLAQTPNNIHCHLYPQMFKAHNICCPKKCQKHLIVEWERDFLFGMAVCPLIGTTKVVREGKKCCERKGGGGGEGGERAKVNADECCLPAHHVEKA